MGDPNRDLCFIPATGGSVSCIEDADETVSRPVWSTDGRVIFVGGRGLTENQLELVRYASPKPSSANKQDWTDQGAVTDTLHGQRAGDSVFYASFSPDGKQLAFTANWKQVFPYLLIATVKGGQIEREGIHLRPRVRRRVAARWQAAAVVLRRLTATAKARWPWSTRRIRRSWTSSVQAVARAGRPATSDRSRPQVLCGACRRQVSRGAAFCPGCGAPVSGGEVALDVVLPDGVRVPLTGTLSIGRSADNAIQLDDRSVSRHHARVAAAKGGAFVEDAGSTHGTFLDGRPIGGRTGCATVRGSMSATSSSGSSVGVTRARPAARSSCVPAQACSSPRWGRARSTTRRRRSAFGPRCARAGR